jgi:hypothetical protein
MKKIANNQPLSNRAKIEELRAKIIALLEPLKANVLVPGYVLAERLKVNSGSVYFQRALKTVRIRVVWARTQVDKGLVLARPSPYYQLATKKVCANYRLMKAI